MFDVKTEAYLRRLHSTARAAPRPSTTIAAVVAANLSMMLGLLLYISS
jgi:hypothetical protein